MYLQKSFLWQVLLLHCGVSQPEGDEWVLLLPGCISEIGVLLTFGQSV